jgi:predicted nucleotidyltransferase
MRLAQYERQIIRETVSRRFGPEAKVRLFGSRTNDDARGGDIDLLIETPAVPENAFREAIGLETELQMALGDQKIDILLCYPGCREEPIHEIARQTGLPL